MEVLAGDTRLVSGSADRELRVFSLCSSEGKRGERAGRREREREGGSERRGEREGGRKKLRKREGGREREGLNFEKC